MKNLVVLIGNLTRDVEVRHTDGGLAIAKTGIAVNEKRKASDGTWKETTVYVDLTCFGKTGEALSQHFSKGSGVSIQGKLDFYTWADKNSGEDRSKLSVIVEKWSFLPSPGKQEVQF